jgi:hypothetical protein
VFSKRVVCFFTLSFPLTAGYSARVVLHLMAVSLPLNLEIAGSIQRSVDAKPKKL